MCYVLYSKSLSPLMSELLFNLNDLHLPPPTIQLYDEVMITYFFLCMIVFLIMTPILLSCVFKFVFKNCKAAFFSIYQIFYFILVGQCHITHYGCQESHERCSTDCQSLLCGIYQGKDVMKYEI